MKKPLPERDELCMNVWQNLINALSNLVEHPASGNEDLEGTF